jgi:hypothetical protein
VHKQVHGDESRVAAACASLRSMSSMLPENVQPDTVQVEPGAAEGCVPSCRAVR